MVHIRHVKKGILLALIPLFVIAGFSFQTDDSINIDLSNRIDDTGDVAELESIRIAVSAIVSPEETMNYYQDLFDYISSKMGVQVKLVQRKTYQEVNDLIRRNSVDAAFICSLAYVEGSDQFGMELLVVPIVQGEPRYYSYIIVPKDSNITSLSDLEGKTFAYTDPLSNSGKLSPEFILTTMGEDPVTFFKFTFFTYSHDKSIQAVADNLVDAAAVDSLVWDYQNATNPRFTSRTKIINVSPPYGIPPVVVSKDIDPALKEKLRTILLQIHEDPKGREILAHLRIDRFSEANDNLFSSIREMRDVVKDAGGNDKQDQ